MSKQKKVPHSNTIALNRKARHNYSLSDQIEAGIMLQGWEVKSLRAGHLQLQDGYVSVRDGEAWLKGVQISPLSTASTHVVADPLRERKLLLNRREINKLIGLTQEKGITIVPLAAYWKQGKVKLEIAVATGKKQHDKRDSIKKRDWERQQQRLARSKLK